MLTLAAQPSIDELNGFVNKVRTYPISARQLQQFARQTKAPKRIIDFYKNFLPDRVFADQEDLAASSEQVEMMRQAEAEMPKEEEKAPEEY